MTALRKPSNQTPDLREILAAAPLPAMPDCAIQLLQISNDPSKDALDLAKPIEADAGMASQLLRYSNSSYFGFRHEIGSVQQAVSMLGVNKVRNFVLGSAVFGIVPDPGSRVFSMMTFRCDSLRRGVFARAVAGRLARAGAEDAFTGGLLQDISLPVLIKQFGEPYLTLVQRCQQHAAPLAEFESRTFSWTHAEASALLLERWSLPSALVDLVRTHAEPEALVDRQESAAAVAVAVSSLLPSFRDQEWPHFDRFATCWDRLAIASQTPLPDLLVEVDEAFGNLSQALHVGAGGQSLAALHDGATAETAGA